MIAKKRLSRKSPRLRRKEGALSHSRSVKSSEKIRIPLPDSHLDLRGKRDGPLRLFAKRYIMYAE